MKLGKWKLAVCSDCESEDYGRAIDGEHVCVECADDWGWNKDGWDLDDLREDIMREESHSDADPGL